MKRIIQLLQIVSPKLVAKMAYNFMSNPRKRKLRSSEELVLDKATLSKVRFKQFDVQKFEWGESNSNTALLIHGWEGQAGNFAALVDQLVQKNYHVVAFDAPSHGRSSRGTTSMFEFSEFIANHFGGLNPKLVISHSFGSVNTATILRNNPEFNLDSWIMVTTPHDFLTRVNGISEYFGMKNEAKTELIKLIQNDTNENISELNMATYCGELSNVEKATIVHSKTDTVLPIEGARVVTNAFKKSTLIELDGLGHYSILWSEELNEIVSKTVKPS